MYNVDTSKFCTLPLFYHKPWCNLVTPIANSVCLERQLDVLEVSWGSLGVELIKKGVSLNLHPRHFPLLNP